MALPFLSGAAGGLGALGSILGGGAAANGADNAADYTKNIMSWLKDVANNQLDKSLDAVGDTKRSVLGESRNLHKRSLGTARDARDANTKLLTGSRDSGLRAIRGDRRDGMRDIRTNRRENLGDINRTARTNIGDINRTESSNLGDIASTKRQNIGTARNQLGKSLEYFNPAIQQGNNALSAFSQMLGLRGGNYDMGLTPATQYLLDEGRTTVEGGAAGAGGLYSGETLAELEKMRHGLVSQDYDKQMAQLLGLVGIGQGAGANAATLRSGFADDVGTYRTSARDAGIEVRGGASAGRVGVRDDASDARVGVRDDATQARIGLRDDTTDGMNALRMFYDPALVGVNDTFANRTNAADVTFANMNTTAHNNALRDILDSRQFMQKMKLSSGTSLAPTAAEMIAGKGAAKAGGIIGATNALMGGIGNMAYNQGVQTGGAPGVAPMVGGGSPYATAPSAPMTAMPWMQQPYMPQPPSGANWTGALY